MIDIEAIIPGGILCLWSAWSIHQLTTSMPQAYHIAIKRDRKVVTPSFPSIELHHYTASILEIGVSKMVLEGYNIRIYDIERCVCFSSCFRFEVTPSVCIVGGIKHVFHIAGIQLFYSSLFFKFIWMNSVFPSDIHFRKAFGK